MPGPRALRVVSTGALLALALGAGRAFPARDDVGARGAVRVSVGSPVGDNVFAPAIVEVASGGAIEWVYEDGNGDGHSISAQPGEPESFDSHPSCRRVGDVEVLCMEDGDPPFPWTFDGEGDYEVEYYCRAHGRPNVDPDDDACGMCGRIKVVAADPKPSPTRAVPSSKPSRGATADAARRTPTPTASASPGGAAAPGEDESALSSDRDRPGAGGRVGLAFLFWFLLGMAARQVWRRYLATDWAGRPRPPRTDL